MPRKRAAATDSNREKFKKVKEYASKLKRKEDATSEGIKQVYENNIWDLDTKFKQLQEEYKKNSNNSEIGWLEGVQYMDYKTKPRITKKISLQEFMDGEYKSMFVEKPNTIATEADYAKRIKFYTRTFEPFKKYEGKDDVSWVVSDNHLLFYEVLRYNNSKGNVFMSLNKDMKTILRTIRLQLGNKHELVYKFSSLSTGLSGLADSADDENKVATDRELSQFIRYEDLIRTADILGRNYKNELNQLPVTDRANGDKHSNRLFHMHQMYLLVSLYVFDYPSRAEKLGMSFITDEKKAKPDKNYILVRNEGQCKMIFNEIKKKHNPLSYDLITDTPTLSGFNRRLNHIIRMSYDIYPREHVFIGKNDWQGKRKPVSAGTVSNWLSDMYKNRNLGVNTFRSSFVTYYIKADINNKEKKEMATRMRTSTIQIDQAYRKIIQSPEDRAKVKLEALENEDDILVAQTNISTGTTKYNPVILNDGEVIRAAIPIPPRPAIPIRQEQPPPAPVDTHARKRKNFQTWYSDEKNADNHRKKVAAHSKLPTTYAKRTVRELNNKKIQLQNLLPSTIDKYGIKRNAAGVFYSTLLNKEEDQPASAPLPKKAPAPVKPVQVSTRPKRSIRPPQKLKPNTKK